MLFGTALAVFISASLPESSIQRDSGAAVVGLAAALIGVIIYESRQESPPDAQADADLRRRCRQLGQQIAIFAANRRVSSPDPRSDVNEVIRYLNETVSLYSVQFMGPALALYDDLEERGWAFDRHRFELPTNPLGIEEIARNLQAIGEGG